MTATTTRETPLTAEVLAPGGMQRTVETGQRFGRLTVITPEIRIPQPSNPERYRRGARLLCDCGNIREVPIKLLYRGHAKSCGCLKRDTAGRSPQIVLEVGQRFGRGVVIDPDMRLPSTSRSSGRRGARLSCDCGNTYEATLTHLLSVRVRSCGCLHQEAAAAMGRAGATHGLHSHLLYKTWQNMMARCGDTRNKHFEDYGGRGIRVCPEWQDVTAFITWMDKNLGPRPDGCSLDRRDNDGDYRPGNVRWATAKEQGANRRPRRKKAA